MPECTHRHIRTKWLNDPSWPKWIEAICLDCNESMSYLMTPHNMSPPPSGQSEQNSVVRARGETP